MRMVRRLLSARSRHLLSRFVQRSAGPRRPWVRSSPPSEVIAIGFLDKFFVEGKTRSETDFQLRSQMYIVINQ